MLNDVNRGGAIAVIPPESMGVITPPPRIRRDGFFMEDVLLLKKKVDIKIEYL